MPIETREVSPGFPIKRRRISVDRAAEEHTQVHDMVSTDGAVVDDNVPGPESDGVPLSK